MCWKIRHQLPILLKIVQSPPIHAGNGSNHLNLHVELQTCLLSRKSVSDARFLHVRNILDETKEKGCYALNAMLVSTEYMWNVQEKPRKAAFQLSTWCWHFQHSCIQANMQLNLHVEMFHRLEKWKFNNDKNVLTTWSGHARPSARPPIYMSKKKRKTT